VPGWNPAIAGELQFKCGQNVAILVITRHCQEWSCQTLLRTIYRPVGLLRQCYMISWPDGQSVNSPRTLILFISFILCNRLIAGSSDQTWSGHITRPTVVYQTVVLHGLCAAIPLVYILVGNTLYSLDLILTWFSPNRTLSLRAIS